MDQDPPAGTSAHFMSWFQDAWSPSRGHCSQSQLLSKAFAEGDHIQPQARAVMRPLNHCPRVWGVSRALVHGSPSGIWAPQAPSPCELGAHFAPLSLIPTTPAPSERAVTWGNSAKARHRAPCLPPTARRAVRVRGHPHHREHCDRHHAAPVHVRLHWGPALQGGVSARSAAPCSSHLSAPRDTDRSSHRGHGGDSAGSPWGGTQLPHCPSCLSDPRKTN